MRYPVIVVALAALAAVARPVDAQHPPSLREGQRLSATVDRPDVIFRNHCSVCHGEKGDGQSFARHGLVPPPEDFTSGDAKKELSRAHMIETVKKGARTESGAPTAMQSFTGRLTDRHIQAVVDYIIVKFMDGKVQPDSKANEGQGHHGHSHAHVKAAAYPFGLEPDARRGKGLYETLCVKCHGANGDGRGTQVPQGAKPRNFRDPDFREFANGFTMFSAVSRGSAHMPAWSQSLSNQDIADISAHVLARFVKPDPVAKVR